MAKLFRLIYLLDVGHLQQTGVTVTGETFTAYRFGPAPDHLYAMIEGGPGSEALHQLIAWRGDESIDVFGRVLRPTNVAPVIDHFTPRQVSIANALFERWAQAHWAEIELSDGGAYDATWEQGRGHGRRIDLALAFSPADADAGYARARYDEDLRRQRAMHHLYGNAA